MLCKYPALATIFTTLVLLAAYAHSDVNADQVRGEVIDVDPEYRSLTLRITESGGERPAEPGSVVTYHIPGDANFEMEATVDSVLYRSYQDPTLSQIDKGDAVLIDFEALASRQELKKVRQEEPTRSEMRDLILRSFAIVETDPVAPAYLADSSRDVLPKTASILPYFPILAFAFVGAALLVRRVRQRRPVNLNEH